MSYLTAVIVDPLELQSDIYTCKYYNCAEVYTNKAQKCKWTKMHVKADQA